MTHLPIKKGASPRKRLHRFFRILGPGVITGAADDDPSGIATYSQAGAKLGTGLLWAFPLMCPLLIAVQESCARIGAVTGKGLAAVIKEHYGRGLLYFSVLLVVSANILNIGTDLGAMAATTRLILPLPFGVLAVLYSAFIVLLEIFVPYKAYAKILIWLSFALLAYPLTAFVVGQNWGRLLSATFHVQGRFDFETVYLLVGMLGTTISPYLFFWDTSEVVEEKIARHRLTKKESHRHLRSLRVDNFVGMTLSSLSAWFIVVVCASVLFANGIKEIDSAADAAKALEPLVRGFPNAGLVAKLIFSVGILGLGLLAVPVLAGSSSYAISETLGWQEGLYQKFKSAQGFYGIIAGATLVGLSINFFGIDPIKALVFTAVFNGIASVPLLWMIARIGNDEKIMREFKNGWLSNLGVRAAFLLMGSSVLVLFYMICKGGAR
ncbi:MAG: divalent metal cation transporter [bacterium]